MTTGLAFTVAFITVLVGIPAFTMGYVLGNWEPPDNEEA